MALSKKQRSALKLSDRRRARRPEPVVRIASPIKVTAGERNRITNQNPQMMLRLERTLLDEAERNAEIDDLTIVTALRCCVRNQEPTVETAKSVAAAIQHWIEMEDDEGLTDLAMRVVYQSIKTRSRCNAGDYDYLMFASSFVKQAVMHGRYAS